jgi:hypothetical protein
MPNMGEGYKFFLIVLMSIITLGLVYYFTSANRGISASAGVDLSLEGTKENMEDYDEEGFTDGVDISGEMGQTQMQHPYQNKMSYLQSQNQPPIMGADSAQEQSMNPALEQLRQSSCFPKDVVKPEELLPQSNATIWSESNPASGSLKNKNMLQSGNLIGINTVGSTLRNANLQLRSEPPCSQVTVSPWMQTTIQPDLGRQPLEIGCGPM